MVVKALFSVLLVQSLVACGTHDRVSPSEEEESCPPVVLDGGGGIEGPPDGEALCPTDADCNYQSGDGCASDESCQPKINETEPLIRPACWAAGEGTDRAPCVAWADPSDCASGYFCAAGPDDNRGECRKLCCGGDWSACNEGTSCYRPLLFRIDGEDLPADTGLCFDTGCDVLDPESCAGDSFPACKIVDPTGATACVSWGPGEAGDECETPDYCGTGLSCVGNACRRLCRAEECGVPACKADEGTCVHFDRDPPGVGECTPWGDTQ